MKNALSRTSMILAAVSGLAFALPAFAQPSSYPKLYTDGHGLAITRMLLERNSGSTWVAATSYQPMQKYRFRMRFTNYFHNSIPVMGGAFGNSGIHIAEIEVTMKLAFAKFDTSGRADERAFLMPRRVNNHPDFNDTVAPTQSRWFTFGHFTWNGPAAALNQYPLEMYTSHREIVYMPNAPWARLIPNR